MGKDCYQLTFRDRFWWENLEWTEEEKQEIQATTLGKIILRNTDTEKIQCYVMALPDSCVLGNGTSGGGGPTDDYGKKISFDNL